MPDVGKVSDIMKSSFSILAGLVVLLVPSAALRAGPHRMNAAIGGTVLLDTPFEVVGP